MSESTTHDAIEAVARDSYGRLVAYIASRTGDIADAQDALSEALVAALETWPTNGVPDKPEAWLVHVTRNRLIDAPAGNKPGEMPSLCCNNSPGNLKRRQRRTSLSRTNA